jgi:hypothetical protein
VFLASAVEGHGRAQSARKRRIFLRVNGSTVDNKRPKMVTAAAELAISQPAVSRAIADMVRALGLGCSTAAVPAS